MSAHARRYFERPPRYVLNASDNSMMRFRDSEPNGLPVNANVVDVSATGMAFVMEGPEIPYLHETLKVEFTIPGKQQIACFANVVRIDLVKKWHPDRGEEFATKVALKFQELPFVYQRALQKSLDDRVHPEEDFDDAGERSLITRTLHFSIATVALLMLFLTMQVAPVRFLSIFLK